MTKEAREHEGWSRNPGFSHRLKMEAWEWFDNPITLNTRLRDGFRQRVFEDHGDEPIRGELS